MRLETSLKLFGLKLKMRLFYMNYIKPRLKKIIITICAIVVCAGVGFGIYAYRRAHCRYFYIDYAGNKGVADWCGQTDTGLVCDRTYGGKVVVVQYWRGN